MELEAFEGLGCRAQSLQHAWPVGEIYNVGV